MREGRLEQVGDVLLNEHLVVGGRGRVQCSGNLAFLHQVEHVGQDRRVHGQT